MGFGFYEIGFECFLEVVVVIEVCVDGFLFRDGVSGSSWSMCHVVRSSFESLGERCFEIVIFNVDGSYCGIFCCMFVLC